jgi:uncharacterized membrane protein
VRVQHQHWSGPLPPPAVVEHLESIVSGAGNRLICLVENEQSIRARESRALIMNDRIKILGSISISLLMILAGVFCGLSGQPVLGGVIATSGAIAGIARQFFAARDAK